MNPPPPAYEDPNKHKNGPNPDPSAGYTFNNASYGYGNAESSAVDPDFGASGFDNHNVRQRFIKKVTGILGIQLLMTFGLVLATNLTCDAKTEDGGSVYQVCMGPGTLFSMPLVFTSMAGSIILLFGALCCCNSLLRKSPHNFIFLFVWTLMESHLVAFAALKYNPSAVTLAMGITAGIVLLVSGLVWFTKFDFTKLLPAMIIVCFVWFFCTLFGRMFFGEWMSGLYAAIGCTIFTIFLAIDLKMIVGGGKYELSEDDYVLGAIYIYLDIINIFLYILQFFNSD